MTTNQNPLSQHVKYASFRDRFIAFIADVIIVFLLFTGMNELFNTFIPTYQSHKIPEIIIAGIIWVIYCGFLESSRYQATIGKRIMRIKVVNEHGKGLLLVRACLRSIVAVFSILPLGYSVWGIASNTRKQAWHDLWLGCYVINY